MSIKTVAVIDYGAGNLRSVTKSFQRASESADGAFNVVQTSSPDVVASADYVVLPGVGAYADCKAGFEAIDGMHEALEQSVIKRGQPFLGICVGMQLMATRGLEKTVTEGFGWFDGDVVKIETNDPSIKIPQIGWNILHVTRPHPVLNDIKTGEDGYHAYFVHSYHMQMADNKDRIAYTDYSTDVTAMIGRDNLVGTQFHPEKSQDLGLKLIENFLNWRP